MAAAFCLYAFNIYVNPLYRIETEFKNKMYTYPLLSIAFIFSIVTTIDSGDHNEIVTLSSLFNVESINLKRPKTPVNMVDIDSASSEFNDFSFKQSPILASKTTSLTQKVGGNTTTHGDIEAIIGTIKNLENKSFHFIEIPIAEVKIPARKVDPIAEFIARVDYWDTVYSIESKQGKFLYRPRNKSRNCTWTTSPCGHHQLSVQALKDIGCKSLQCKKDRLNFAKSLKMSKKLLAKKERRLQQNGYTDLEDYQRYLIHQQGATGIKTIIAASKGKKLLSKRLKKNMAGNSPFSYRQLRKMGSKLAAKKFMQHWKNKWQSEKRLVSGIDLVTKEIPHKQSSVPTFSENDLQLALNFKF